MNSRCRPPSPVPFCSDPLAMCGQRRLELHGISQHTLRASTACVASSTRLQITDTCICGTSGYPVQAGCSLRGYALIDNHVHLRLNPSENRSRGVPAAERARKRSCQSRRGSDPLLLSFPSSHLLPQPDEPQWQVLRAILTSPNRLRLESDSNARPGVRRTMSS